MLETVIVLTPIHYVYLLGVIVILAAMIFRLDTPPVCILFLFLLGLLGLGTITGGIQAVFLSILYAAKEFMEIIATIALVTALSKCLSELGSSRILMAPMTRIMKNPSITWWILGISMFIFSLFLWPSPSVALVGAIMIPFAVRSGLHPLMAAVAVNLAGHGFALSYDLIVQGAPAISAKAAGITAGEILGQGGVLFWVMGLSTMLTAYLVLRPEINHLYVAAWAADREDQSGPGVPSGDTGAAGNGSGSAPGSGAGSTTAPGSIPSLGSLRTPPRLNRAAWAAAILTPAAFAADIIAMVALNLTGGDATSLVSGTALVVMCVCAALGFGRHSLEKITGYVTEGFLFAIRIFAPVIVIGAFFFLGGSGLNAVMGREISDGLMNDWALWLAAHAPLNKYITLFIQMVVGGLTGLDGSGFSGLPLTGALARTFGLATGASIPVLAAVGQITAVFVGGGPLVPWGLIPVAAICGVDPLELARKNFAPVMVGFLCTFAAACIFL